MVFCIDQFSFFIYYYTFIFNNYLVFLFLSLFYCDISFFFKKIIYIFYLFWLCGVFVAACGLSLVVVNRGYSLLRCVGCSLRWLLLLQNTCSRHVGSVIVAHQSFTNLWISGQGLPFEFRSAD